MDFHENCSAKNEGYKNTRATFTVVVVVIDFGSWVFNPLFECGMWFLITLVKASLKPRFLKCVTVICIDSQKPQAKSLIHRSKAKMYFR